MTMHPYVAKQIADERRRELLAVAQAQQLVALAKASRRSERAEQRMRRSSSKPRDCAHSGSNEVTTVEPSPECVNDG
jgi:hypothetical protein